MAAHVAAKKVKKKKEAKTLSLQEFLGDNPTIVVKQQTKLNWADESENITDDEPTVTFSRPSLPTAPRAARATNVDLSKIPTDGPFTAYMGNLPFDVSNEDIYKFFGNSKVVNIRLQKDQAGRTRGFGYVEFENRQMLVDALSLNDANLKNRPIKVDLVGHNQEGEGRPGVYNRQQDDGDDKTLGDWRKKDPSSSNKYQTKSYSSDKRYSEDRDDNSDRYGFKNRSDRMDSTDGGFNRNHFNDRFKDVSNKYGSLGRKFANKDDRYKQSGYGDRYDSDSKTGRNPSDEDSWRRKDSHDGNSSYQPPRNESYNNRDSNYRRFRNEPKDCDSQSNRDTYKSSNKDYQEKDSYRSNDWNREKQMDLQRDKFSKDVCDDAKIVDIYGESAQDNYCVDRRDRDTDKDSHHSKESDKSLEASQYSDDVDFDREHRALDHKTNELKDDLNLDTPVEKILEKHDSDNESRKSSRDDVMSKDNDWEHKTDEESRKISREEDSDSVRSRDSTWKHEKLRYEDDAKNDYHSLTTRDDRLKEDYWRRDANKNDRSRNDRDNWGNRERENNRDQNQSYNRNRDFRRENWDVRRDDRDVQKDGRDVRRDERDTRKDDKGVRRDDRDLQRDDRYVRRDDKDMRRDDKDMRRDDRDVQKDDKDMRRDDRHEDNKPKERPKLNLQPRTKPVEVAAQIGSSAATTSSSIFGGAKPVDTTQREREIELKLKNTNMRNDESHRDDIPKRSIVTNKESGEKMKDLPISLYPQRTSFSSDTRLAVDTKDVSDVSSTHNNNDQSSEKSTPVTQKMVPAPPPKENIWEKRKTNQNQVKLTVQSDDKFNDLNSPIGMTMDDQPKIVKNVQNNVDTKSASDSEIKTAEISISNSDEGILEALTKISTTMPRSQQQQQENIWDKRKEQMNRQTTPSKDTRQTTPGRMITEDSQRPHDTKSRGRHDESRNYSANRPSPDNRKAAIVSVKQKVKEQRFLPTSIDEMPKLDDKSKKDWQDVNKFSSLMDDDEIEEDNDTENDNDNDDVSDGKFLDLDDDLKNKNIGDKNFNNEQSTIDLPTQTR